MEKTKLAITMVLLSLSMTGIAPFLRMVSALPDGSASSNVAVINSQGDFFGFGNVGQLNPATFPSYTFTALAASTVTGLSSLAGFDTVILWQFCDVGSFPSTQSAINSFVMAGGKVIIWDTDSCQVQSAPFHGVADYIWLTAVGASFAVRSGTGDAVGGSLTIVDENNLDCSDSAKACFIDTAAIASTTDAVGAGNLMVPSLTSPAWCADKNGTNVQGAGGFAEAYTAPGALTGAPAGLIIYTGLDWDFVGIIPSSVTPGGPFLIKVMALQLAHGWGPAGSPAVSDLKCQVIIHPIHPGLNVSKFFTDTSLNPLPLDQKGNPKVDVVLAGGVVRSTNPGEIMAWVKVSNTDGSLQSLKLNETLPMQWVIAPPWKPALGAIHVFYDNTTSLATNPEITQPSTITVSGASPPQTVHVAIPSLNATAIGHPLLKNQSILLEVKLDYALDGSTQSASTFPRNYTDTANAKGWTMPSFIGTAVGPSTGTGLFTAYAKVVGDVDGDRSVDITDLVLVWQHQFSNNPQNDVNGDGAVDINDLVLTWQYQFA